MKASIGFFGKIPSHPEFISTGMSSKTARSFERWLQMSNDQLARADVELPKTPIGFVFRDEAASALLVGVLAGSRDKVGRNFPVAVFCEVSPAPPDKVSRLAEVFRPTLTQLSMFALSASETTRDALKNSLRRIDVPTTEAIKQGLSDSEEALTTVSLEDVLSRIFASTNDRAYGIHTLIRACERCRQDGPSRPTSIDTHVTSDMELSFWLAAVEARLTDRHGPVSAFWYVPDQRMFVVPGSPDSKLLLALASPTSTSTRLWRTETSSVKSRDAAWDKLSKPIRAMLEDSGDASIQAFLRLLEADADQAAAEAAAFERERQAKK